MSAQDRRAYEFERFLLVPGERLLLRDGVPVKLTDKTFDLLVELVRGHGRLAEKDRLMEALWPGTFVEEGNLTKHVSLLRKTLGADGGPARYVETVPKRGFRFVASVREVPAPPAPGGAERDGPRSLAVLPFRVDGFPAEGASLSLGLADAIIARLSASSRVAVRSTSAVMKFAEAPADAATAGRELRVDAVLEGRIARSGDRVRATVQFVEVATGRALWAETFDGTYRDLFSVEESIAARTGAAFEAGAASSARARLYTRYTEDVEAYGLYSLGRARLLRYTRDDALASVEAFESALRLDPEYALAHAGLALACALVSRRFAGRSDLGAWEERARREAATALAIEPNLAEAHEALGAVFRYTEVDWDETIRESSLALALNPNLELPHYHRAVAYSHIGLLELVDADATAGLEINPLNRFEPLRLRGMAELFAGRYPQAVGLLEEARRASGGTVADWHLAQACWYEGDRERAESMLLRLCASEAEEERARSQALLASVLAARGAREAAGRHLDAVVGGEYVDHHVAYSAAAAYAQLGDPTRALRWLARAAETGLRCYPWYARDPLIRPLEGAPGFDHFMEGMRAAWEAARARYGAAGGPEAGLAAS